jgi:MOSC domain-containing protein YiiM
MEENGRTGWYFRVIEEGYVEAGTSMRLLERPHPQWTVADAHRLVYEPQVNLDQIQALASCSALSASWRETLLKKLTVTTGVKRPVQAGPEMGVNPESCAPRSSINNDPSSR